MAGKILISGLTAQTTIGVYAWERQIKQKIVLDLEIIHDIAACELQDDLASTLDYAVLSERITKVMETESYQLLETFANKIATVLQQEFNLKRFQLRLSKPYAVANAVSVGVELTVG